MSEHYTDINAKTVDGWVAQGWEWGQPISRETYRQALAGDWQMLLTPLRPVPKIWYPDLNGCRVLGLACGGGQQMPIFAALGAECTVLDYSLSQLKSEEEVAAREGYDIRIVRHDMTRPLPFEDEAFDLIFHPVSNCYIEQVRPLWRECLRVLRPGGILMAGLDIGPNFMFDDAETTLSHRLPYNPLKDPDLMREAMKNGDGVQFSHTLEEQIGGQLEAGFTLTHLYEDTNSSGRLHDYGVPCFAATRAVKAYRR